MVVEVEVELVEVEIDVEVDTDVDDEVLEVEVDVLDDVDVEVFPPCPNLRTVEYPAITPYQLLLPGPDINLPCN